MGRNVLLFALNQPNALIISSVTRQEERMAARKSERLMNLTIALLCSRRFLEKEQIRKAVQGYEGLNDESFDRAFERDKEELRSLGVPIETGSNSYLFDDEVGYRILRSDFELPQIEFSPDEAAVLAVAAQVWQNASNAKAAGHALSKLTAAGVSPDRNRLAALQPRINVREKAFEPLWNATLHKQLVSFSYKGATATRNVAPWRLLQRKGAWYLLGFDINKKEERIFKLSRIDSAVKIVSEPNAFELPANVDLSELAARLENRSAPEKTAVLALRDGRAQQLRRIGFPAPQEHQVPAGYSAWVVPYSGSYFLVGELARNGADALVLEPLELREEVATHLEGLLAALHVENRQDTAGGEAK
jgi:proteasome accessory factor B